MNLPASLQRRRTGELTPSGRRRGYLVEVETKTTVGVRRCRPHDLRHTAASVLLMQGADMRTVMEVLGHSRLATTSDLYTHVLAEVKADAASRRDSFLRGLQP